MPIHDWTKVDAVIFQDFHGNCIHVLKHALNKSVLTSEYYAISEQIGIESKTQSERKKNRLAIRQSSGDKLMAIIEILSPGNNGSNSSLPAFINRTVDLLAKRVHLLLVDLFPPTPRDPQGIHTVIQEELGGNILELPTDKPLTLAAYEADDPPKAYVEPVAVGDVLPDMPLFLFPGGHVLVPLEKTYLKAWEGVPARWRKVIESETN